MLSAASSAPDDFQLDPVKEGLHLPPVPPSQLKPEIYRDLSIFKDVDEHAINESRLNYPTFRDLVWNLVLKNKYSDLEKARAIFRWMTCSDLNNISFAGEPKPNSAEQLLVNFKSGKTTYARIFECLARNAGLAAVTITGWAKGVDYRPGVAITRRPVNHSWNAVYLDGNWQLVDVHWATRFLQSESNTSENLVYEYDDFYFITRPDQLAYTHRPEDDGWQLLATPQTAEQFEDYPLVKSYFFVNQMYFLPNQNHGVIYAQKGIAALSLGFKSDASYTFKLVCGDSGSDVEINNYVVQETKNNIVTYYIRLPRRGNYYLIVFAHLTVENILSPENVFKAVAEYKIVGGSDIPTNDVVPFPSCSDLSWGPDTFLIQYGLAPGNADAILQAPNGRALVALDKSRPEVRLYARLVKKGVPDTTLRRALTVKNAEDKATINVELPEQGEYGLELFANDPKKDGDMFTHVCQYLVFFTDQDFDDIYGKPGDVATSRAGFAGAALADVDETDLANEYSADYAAEGAPDVDAIVPQGPVEPEQEYQPHEAELYTTAITDVAPPENFNIAPVESQGEAPIPDTSSSSTYKPFIDSTVFEHVDAHALEVSKLEHVTFRAILWHLIYARGIKNELDRARAIFLWLCSKDLAKLNFTNVESGSPEEILMNLKEGHTTYARVYETLCRYGGLHCKTLTGFAKGADYKPGMQFAGQQSQHSWNAVLVNGTWQLVDCHWAARRLVGQKTQQSTSDNVRYELDEYYFMPAPSQLVFTHFPEDPKWQLLERQVTLEEFEKLVPVKPAFFKYGLQLVSHTDAVIQSQPESDVNIRLQCPRKKRKVLRFTFNLVKENGSDVSDGGIKLNRFAMQEVVNRICYLTVRPPDKGSYLLTIYAKDLNDKTKEGVYGGICEYKIVSEESHGEPRPFPPCVHTTWGPGDSASKFDMVPLQAGAILHTSNGVAEVRFRLVTKLRFVSKLKSNDADEKALAPYVLFRIVNGVANFRVNAPSVGEFGLEIYANNPESGGTSLQHAYQYLIVCKELKSTPVQTFPTLPAGSLGPQPNFETFGLSATSHADPYIVTDTGDLQISFALTKPLRTTSQLSIVSETPARDASEYILQQGGTYQDVTFILQLPQPGMYKFSLFAIPQTETAESLPSVYTYLIHCRQTVSAVTAFPKQFAAWKEGCYLYEPLEGHIAANRQSKGSASTYQHLYFKLDVPRAVNVAVVVGTEWTQLEQKASGSWQGEVLMEKHWEKDRKVTVCANFGKTATSYSTLLEYSI